MKIKLCDKNMKHPFMVLWFSVSKSNCKKKIAVLVFIFIFFSFLKPKCIDVKSNIYIYISLNIFIINLSCFILKPKNQRMNHTWIVELLNYVFKSSTMWTVKKAFDYSSTHLNNAHQEKTWIIYLLLLCWSWCAACKGGKGKNSPKPKDSWLLSGWRGTAVGMGLWPASVSSSDALLLDTERRRGRRNLKPRGRPEEKKVDRQRVTLLTCSVTSWITFSKCCRS